MNIGCPHVKPGPAVTTWWRSFLLLALVLISLAPAPAASQDNLLPMYGGRHDPQVPRDPGLSRKASNLGWRFLYQGDLDTAMRRFNQAWMLDRDNCVAFWGFGVVMGRRAIGAEPEKNLRESIRLLEKARELCPKDGGIAADLAFSHVGIGRLLQENGRSPDAEYAEAETLFAAAAALTPDYPPTYSNWAVLKFYQGDFPGAKKLLQEAAKRGQAPDPAFERDLDAHLGQASQ